MKSTTSSSKVRQWFYPTLWRKNMARFWPIWAVYGLFWLFVLPFSLINGYHGGYEGEGLLDGANYFANYSVLDYGAQMGILVTLFFGLLAAMAVFSYLYQARSAGMLHALPVRREGLFLTNYLSGLSFLALPAAAVFLLTLLAEAAMGCLNAVNLVIWLACQVLYALFFYSFAVFCAMFTGHILALPAFYGILNGLAVGVVTLTDQVLRQFVYGFGGIRGMGEAALWLTPVAKLASQVNVERVRGGVSDQITVIRFEGFSYVLIYAAAGLVLAALALALYRWRHLESAGDIVSVSWVRPIFKYGVGFCSALALGSLLYAWFGWNLPQGAWTLLAFMLVCGAVGCFVAEMLLKKSFRVFGKGWKGCAILLCVLVAATAVMELDLTGFERRVPDPGRVTAVVLDGVYSEPGDDARLQGMDISDPEVIALITRLHAAVVAEKGTMESESGRGGWYEEVTLADGTWLPEVQRKDSNSLRLTYTLDTGAELRRRYESLIITREMLEDPDSAASQLQALLNRPEVVWHGYFPEDISTWRLVDASMTVPAYEDAAEMSGDELEAYNYAHGDTPAAERVWTGDTTQVELPQAGLDELMAAVRADLEAGDIGRRYLLDDEARLTNCYYNDLRLTFYVPARQAGGSVIPYGDGRGDYVSSDMEEGTRSVTITVQKSAGRTLAVLEELGLADQLVLQSEMRSRG